MLRIKHMVQIQITIFLLVLAALSGGISVFAANESIIYGEPVPASFLNAQWNETAPNDTLPIVGTYVSDLGTLTVDPRPITITPDSKTKTVGSADPELTYQITSGSLVTGEKLKGSLSRVAGETVGNYSILQGDLNNANNPNYEITFIAGKTLTVTAASSSFDAVVKVKYGDSFSSRGKMPDQSYGHSSVPDLEITLYQETPTKDASLQFDAELTSGVQSNEPITLYAALPSNFSQSKEYYVRRTYDGSDSRLTAEIERHGDYYYVVFTTSKVDDCLFRVMRKSSDDRDGGYTISSFWEDVIDDIIDAEYGDRIRVNVGSRTNMAADVLRELKGLPITLSLVRSNGEIINIDGKDVGYISSSRDYFTLSSLADEYITSNRIKSAPVEVSSSSTAESYTPAPSSSAAPSVPYVPQSSTPVVSNVQTWTQPQSSSSVPEPASSSDASSEDEDELSSSLEPSESTQSEDESDIEIMAEEDEPYIDADGNSDNPTRRLSFFPLFVVGSLTAVGILAGILTVSICRGRRNSR